MIKIERMSDGCKATINGNQIFVGQLFDYKEIETLKVTAGKVMYTIDENEIVDVEATQMKVEVKAPAPAAKTVAPAKK